MDDSLNWGKALQGELLERWPRDDKGETVRPAFLCHCKDLDLSDELRINMLEAYGIPCLRLYPGDGSFGKLILGMSGQGVDIFVPGTMLEEAQDLCQSQPETENETEAEE